MISWFNGELVPLDDISIKPDDRGFLLGDGLFETMAANNGVPVYLDHHFKRLHQSCRILKLDLPHCDNKLVKALKDVLSANQLDKTRAALRLTVSRGSAPRGLALPTNPHPNILITATPAPTSFPPIKLKTASIRRNEYSPVCQIKSLCYLDNILALDEVRPSGSDDALILNTAGNIAETTICNIFFIHNDTVITPRPQDGCLNGIMRQMVLKACEKIGILAMEKSLPAHTIQTCESAFVTNSLARLRPVREIDGRQLTQSPLFGRLSEALLEFEINPR